MFGRSRRNLACWFTLTMGSILIMFAAVVYYLKVIDELESLDRLLYKKTRVMAANVESTLHNRQQHIDLENVPLLGSRVPPPLDSELVYARWYNAQKQLVQFFGDTPSELLKVKAGFKTLNSENHQAWLRQVTLPVYQNGLLIGYLQVAIPLTTTENNLADFRLVLAISVPTTLGLITLAGWWLGGLAMQPIRYSYEQLQRFTADASHELRSPLAAVISNAQFGSISSCSNPEQQRQRFQKVVDIAKSMSLLVDNLLFLARHEGRLPAKLLQEVNLNNLLLKLVDDYAKQPVAQHLSLNCELPTNSVNVIAEKDLLSQAIINLLSNACKYTPAGGKVQLKIFTQPHQAIIQVVDNGIGIPEPDLHHIFERFYRVDKKRSRKTGGFGLGLAIAQQIVQAHGGVIRAFSVVGQGSTFEIILPLNK
ncbi:MAG: HAMP domain-containing histidine kinase [Mojavia pulchra JT2-VF2]|jgi:signal transduction histidine kinase|uniref:histidine kinase n=1 Tax=Mojavia pulchra JT2-VF2 TaxID=287848 RepID=A0A951UEN1_9NOST|nr:HAMP domain-containing histidine kinase [Mojavia pulchra JT2-VF2]